MLIDDGGFARTQIIFTQRGLVEPDRVRFWIELEPRASWELGFDVVPSLDGGEVGPHVVQQRFGEERDRIEASLAAWNLRVPRLRASWDDLDHVFPRSVADLASLRLQGAGGFGNLPAAGMPWFMTVFGRDTIITCLQTLLFGPELAWSALEVLADLQAVEDDPSIDAEPGKIVHELRRGKAARNWFERYYGTIDATPLYLILLSEVWRWTDDAALVRRFKEPALRALAWIDEYGDRDGDGFVEYERRSETGLANQSWKDSWDSQRYSDGSLADPPIAPVEAQGYVYDAKRRMAELAREVWRERDLAERLDREADELRTRFDEAFWNEDRGGFYVLALDGDKKQVDSLCSNIGHLLWSGIVPPAKVDAVVDRLMGPHLWSGWGVQDDVVRGRRLQPALVPQRHRLAARQFAHRVGARQLLALAGGAADHPADDERGRPLRVPAARGVRGPPASGDAVPDRIPDGGAAAGLGGRRSGATAPDPARASTRPPEPPAALRAPARAPVLGRNNAAQRDPRVRQGLGRARRGWHRSGRAA